MQTTKEAFQDVADALNELIDAVTEGITDDLKAIFKPVRDLANEKLMPVYTLNAVGYYGDCSRCILQFESDRYLIKDISKPLDKVGVEFVMDAIDIVRCNSDLSHVKLYEDNY